MPEQSSAGASSSWLPIPRRLTRIPPVHEPSAGPRHQFLSGSNSVATLSTMAPSDSLLPG